MAETAYRRYIGQEGLGDWALLIFLVERPGYVKARFDDRRDWVILPESDFETLRERHAQDRKANTETLQAIERRWRS